MSIKNEGLCVCVYKLKMKHVVFLLKQGFKNKTTSIYQLFNQTDYSHLS